jgi:hypothetical protein
MNAPHHHILSVETYDSGGCCPVDFINLKSGQILGIDSETIVLYRDIVDFEDCETVDRPFLAFGEQAPHTEKDDTQNQSLTTFIEKVTSEEEVWAGDLVHLWTGQLLVINDQCAILLESLKAYYEDISFDVPTIWLESNPYNEKPLP